MGRPIHDDMTSRVEPQRLQPSPSLVPKRARRGPTPRQTLAAVVALGVAGMVVVVAAHHSNGSTNPASAASVTSLASSQAPGSAAPPSTDGLSGYGATSSAWDGAHQPDPSFYPGVAYLPVIDGAGGGQDQYTAAERTDGRVVGYELTLPAGTTVQAAQQAVLADFPADAHVVGSFNATGIQADSQGNQSQCVLFNVQSPKLAAVLAPAPYSDASGTIGVELYTTASDGSPTFDPANINIADVGLDGLGPFPITSTSSC